MMRSNSHMKLRGGNALGIYISIPFCRSKCTYCNFASGVFLASDHARYVERVIADIAGARTWSEGRGTELPRRVDTVYLGGGTPSLLAPELVAQLFATMRAEFDLDVDAEITMECAPGQLPDATLAALVAAGVNRVSLGVQSFVDSEAHASGRLHSRAIVEADLKRLRTAGITNLNVDLIAGLAGQTFASWEESLEILIASEVPHASVYMLEVDEDSRLGREMLKGGARYRARLVPHEDAIASMYERAIERLEAAGLRQYEISNFCRPGFASRHNLRYWQRRPYLGVGLDASSMLRAPAMHCESGLVSGRDFSRARTESPLSESFAPVDSLALRATTTDDLQAYLAGTGASEIEWLTPAQQHEEAWFLGLRTNEGVDVAALRAEFGEELVDPAMETAKRMTEDGLLDFDGARARLTARGRLISNEIFQEFLQPEVAESSRRT
ncbi:MAG: radical SAM family heme chaperone HemW [Terracidiphilus sp.]|nr:radical SAM family heme chaperone HemW [Terracidiphilus sp.]MDR3797812.1 radical SAM family heme chaperone HemW [Terracidiphilus sp.]